MVVTGLGGSLVPLDGRDETVEGKMKFHGCIIAFFFPNLCLPTKETCDVPKVGEFVQSLLTEEIYYLLIILGIFALESLS